MTRASVGDALWAFWETVRAGAYRAYHVIEPTLAPLPGPTWYAGVVLLVFLSIIAGLALGTVIARALGADVSTPAAALLWLRRTVGRAVRDTGPVRPGGFGTAARAHLQRDTSPLAGKASPGPSNASDDAEGNPDDVVDVTTTRTPTGMGLDRRRVLYAVMVGVLLVFVAPFVAYAAPQVVGASHSYVVLTGSMAEDPAPVLRPGDVVFVYDTPPAAIDAGDVVTYYSEGSPPVTTHRVVEARDMEDGLYFETKGDANEEADPSLIPAERVVGTVGLHVPLIGHVVVFSSTVEGMVVLVFLPLLLLLVSETWDFARATRQRRSDSQERLGITALSTPEAEPADGETALVGGEGTTDASAAETAPDDEELTLTRTDLRLTLVVLAAFVAYSAVTTVLLQQTWTTAVATTALAGLLLLGGLYLLADWEDDGEEVDAPSLPDGGSRSMAFQRTATLESARDWADLARATNGDGSIVSDDQPADGNEEPTET